MNELIERLKELPHQMQCLCSIKEMSSGHLRECWKPDASETIKDAADTLLALQTQLERAEDAADGYSRGVYSKTMLDAASAIAKGHSDAFLIIDLRAQLERVERETVEKCARVCFVRANQYTDLAMRAHNDQQYTREVEESIRDAVARQLALDIAALPAEQQKG